jgi:hypothetical protein
MRRFLRPPCAPFVLLLGFAVAVSGCGGTHEDRTITFSASGGQVGFQHGREGVFVADKDGGGLTKIFTPDKDTIAVGTPLWAPDGKRLIFTTARAAEKAGPSPIVPGSEEDPAGRVFLARAAVYTCWLRDEAKGDAAPEPRKLFTVRVDDVGYVAAGLAVRWHPKGDRVLYVRQVGGGGHAVFEFDLVAKTSRRVFPEEDTAGAVVFDWAPGGAHLVCLLADTPDHAQDGIWVGRDGADWRHIAESAPLGSPVGLPLERLKATRPAWTRDGERFAFVTALPGKTDDDPGRHFLWVATPGGRRAEQILEERRPLHDLAWHPEGRRLGFLAGDDGGALRVTDLKDDPVTVARGPVRSFAGWDAKGKFLAYTTPDDIPLRDEGGFSLLLFPDPLARDALWVAPGDGTGAGRAVVSGLRTTFVRWSPGEEKLSQWFTFSPTHRSVFSTGLEWGLRRGDPAAVIDAEGGKITWMAVDAHEKAQVGHYHLLKRQYADAWNWYEQADGDRGGAKPAPAGAAPDRRRPFRDPSFFAFYCLDKLGRHDEARARLAAFREKAPALLPLDDPGAAGAARRAVRQLVPLARDFYAAEAFLSLDAAEDGEAFFRRALAEARTDEDRLSAAVVLSQLLLLRGRTGEYATVATETVAPLLLRAWHPQAAGDAMTRWTAQSPPVAVASLAVLPLARPDLLAKLPDGRLNALAADWAALRAKAPDPLSRLAADVILEGLYRRLRRDKEAAEVHQRVHANPLAGGRLSTEEGIEKAYQELRGTLEWRGLAPVLGRWAEP